MRQIRLKNQVENARGEILQEMAPLQLAGNGTTAAGWRLVYLYIDVDEITDTSSEADNPSLHSNNAEFYTNVRRLKPNGDLIENILETWKNQYSLLEDSTVPFLANDETCKRSFIRGFELMRDFYNFCLQLTDTKVIVVRSENYLEQFQISTARPIITSA